MKDHSFVAGTENIGCLSPFFEDVVAMQFFTCIAKIIGADMATKETKNFKISLFAIKDKGLQSYTQPYIIKDVGSRTEYHFWKMGDFMSFLPMILY